MSASKNVQGDTTGGESRVRPARRVGVARIVAGLATIGVASLGLVALATMGGPAATAATTSVAGPTAKCAVTLSVTSTTAAATILHGCTGGNYYLTSYSANSNFKHQHLDAYTNKAPWTVALPPCFYQVDFTLRTGPPGNPNNRVLNIAYLQGGTTCPTTTTSSTTSTTVHTTPTTQPKIGVGGATTTTSTTIKVVSPVSAANPSSAAGSGRSGLAFTGFNAVPVVIAAFGAILAGMALVLSGAKRRRTV